VPLTQTLHTVCVNQLHRLQLNAARNDFKESSDPDVGKKEISFRHYIRSLDERMGFMKQENYTIVFNL